MERVTSQTSSTSVGSDAWEFGEHTECPECGTDCRLMFEEYPRILRLNADMLGALESIQTLVAYIGHSPTLDRIAEIAHSAIAKGVR